MSSFRPPKAEPSDPVPWSVTNTTRFQLSDENDDAPDGPNRGRHPPPRAGACVHCKSLKVRCEFIAGHSSCRRCESGNMECLSRSRKKRKAAPTHEDLQEKAHSQDYQIQNILKQFDKLKVDRKLKEWTDRAHSSAAAEGERQSVLGRTPPDIVRYGCLHPEEIRELFDIFFSKVNPYFSILDPELHTPDILIWTSPFLFTVICAVALRYCPSKRRLYYLAQEFARDAAGKALIEGSKSVSICQAYLLLAVYPVPKKKWTEDRSWLLMGVAIRMAMELELHQPPPPQCDEREALNRTRTWLNCYCVDASHAIQFGKMPMLRLDDYMARTSQAWYRESNQNIAFDVHLCAYVQILLIMVEWRNATSQCNLQEKLREGFDIVAAAIETEEKLSAELDVWVERYAEEYIINPIEICAYRGNTTQLICAYLRLVVLAAGFQQSVKSGLPRNSDLLRRSIDAAHTVIMIMIERLYPTGHLKYALEANFLYVSFAAAYLVNLLRPKFLPMLDHNTQEDIKFTVTRLIEVLSSKEVALNDRHTPALYSRFLKSLLVKYDIQVDVRTPMGEPDPSAHTYSWPDIAQTESPPGRSYPTQYDTGFVYQQSADVDFSINNFVRTVSTQGMPQHPSYDYHDIQTWDRWDGRDNISTNWSSYHNVWRGG
ncbi:hypothetical protein D9758_003209 [Tetrapyrgos nigripes]|uniref:Zn(2)-C6 fungal-type domain-containing protein n=1 Tax=Tetrapyrgos nigripes TaxID=182062 RepID=A0A8H5LQB5_9AGAR|nr:hypothetical protein D9758_003209 [Tetrapyrgos nigripes]